MNKTWGHAVYHRALQHVCFLPTSSPVDFSKVENTIYTHVHTHTHTHTLVVCCWQPLEDWVVMCYVRSSRGERWGFLTHRSRSGLSPRGSAMSTVWLIRNEGVSVCVCGCVCVCVKDGNGEKRNEREKHTEEQNGCIRGWLLWYMTCNNITVCEHKRFSIVCVCVGVCVLQGSLLSLSQLWSIEAIFGMKQNIFLIIK